jgi:hypothetical protein
MPEPFTNARVYEHLTAALDATGARMHASRMMVSSAALYRFLEKLTPKERVEMLGEYVKVLATQGRAGEHGRPGKEKRRKRPKGSGGMGGPGSGPKPNDARDRDVVRLRDQGTSLREIARRLALAPQSLKNALDRQGYADRPGAFRRARGFSHLTAEQLREFAARGARAVHAKGAARGFTSETARAAGRKGHAAQRRARRAKRRPAAGA